jgi:excisionase family DNA binding protein
VDLAPRRDDGYDLTDWLIDRDGRGLEVLRRAPSTETLTPREVAERAGFSYHAILRAIRRGDLGAFEPIPGRYRIEISEYERWLHQPAPRTPAPPIERPRRERRRSGRDPALPGSMARLRAIERS